MQLAHRADFFRQHEYAGIGDDQRIRCVPAKTCKLPEVFFNSGQFIAVRKNIHCHMDFHTVRMCIVDAFFHVFHRKILGIGTQAICLAADVDGIRTVIDGGFAASAPKCTAVLSTSRQLAGIRSSGRFRFGCVSPNFYSSLKILKTCTSRCSIFHAHCCAVSGSQHYCDEFRILRQCIQIFTHALMNRPVAPRHCKF